MKISLGLILTAVVCTEYYGGRADAQEVDDTIGDENASIVVGPASIANIVCDGIVTCKPVYAQVCTTTGLTFSNTCEFENAYCENPRDTFYIESVGPCNEFKLQSIEDGEDEQGGVTKEVLDVPIDIDDVSNPIVNDSGDLESPAIEDLPEGGVDTSSTGSTSNGSTSSTRSRNSDESGAIEETPPAEATGEGTAETTPEATQEGTPTRKPIDCSDGSIACDVPDDPVCASNGFTYINECQFNNAYCEAPSDALYIVSKGPCDNTEVPMQVQSISVEEQEVWGRVFDVPVELDAHASIAQPTEVDCDGNIECQDEDDPVCDSNGNTFRTACDFKNFFCENPSSGVYIVSKGECTTFKSQATEAEGSVTADVLNVPVELDEVAVDADVKNDVYRSRQKLSPYCTLSCPTGNVLVAPLCGTDSRSYINDCHLLSSKCEQPDLEKQYDGLCVFGEAPASRRAASVSGDASIFTQEASRPKCNAFCGRHYAPVCGSNGVTYANQCLLDFASCQNSRITKLGDGRCSEINSASVAEPQSQVACVPTVCPGTEAFVCGSDGQTYLNVCMLNNARCQVPGLTVAHEGECGAATKLTCATFTCPRYSECRVDPATQVAFCADVCHADRCGPNQDCKLVYADCYSAPCSPVATCVPKANYSGDYY